MAKGSRGRQRISSRQYRSAPYHLRFDQDIMEEFPPKNCSKIVEKKDWEDVTCSVCMEYPHNAVLLLCSSHDKGCRPYMCGTSCRYSNCLDQYKKAYTKVISSNNGQSVHGSVDNPIVIQDSSSGIENSEVTELACPLCRGQVKGWTVVEPARDYFNAKQRSCMQDDCSFLGNYKELRRHVRAEHPSARPREVDPVLEQKWRRLERERERNDVMSTITSTMPGAMFFGDYVIEGNNYGFDSDEEGGLDAGAAERNEGYEMGFDSNLVNVFLLLHAFGPSGGDEFNRRMPQPRLPYHETVNGNAVGIRHSTPVGGAESSDQDDDNEDSNDEGGGGGGGGGDMSLASRLRRQGRVILGRSGRRRRRRDVNGGLR